MSRYLKLGAEIARQNHDDWLARTRGDEVTVLRERLAEVEYDLAVSRACTRWWMNYAATMTQQRDRARDTAANLEAALAEARGLQAPDAVDSTTEIYKPL